MEKHCSRRLKATSPFRKLTISKPLSTKSTPTSTSTKVSGNEIFFFATTGKNSFLFQWSTSLFKSDDRTQFNFAEQYMMFKKVKLLNDEVTAQNVVFEVKALEIKASSRQVAIFNVAAWVGSREGIVAEANFLKFIVCNMLVNGKTSKDKLMETGDRC
ncbi:hypothetical protein VTL71DRAFT_13168 [Oculimacula yallundae]|uniref:NADAR domain-containing protein n=1 Tax=Oculimacula yallundae TaxID=86028 RepID=A0ABR4CRC7_9HELO